MNNLKYILVLLLFTFVHQIGFSQVEEDEIFMIVEQPPSFPGCEGLDISKAEKESCAQTKMLEYIYENLTYPKEARINGIEGQVVIQFVVEKNGELKDIVLIRNVEGGCGEAAMKVIESMNQMKKLWNPGKQQGRTVRVKYTLPVKFKLEDDKVNQESILGAMESGFLGESDDEEQIYSVVEEMPRFPGCENIDDEIERSSCSQRKMLEFLYRNLKYPQEARKKGIQGTAVIEFVVNKNGSLSGFKVLRDPGAGCGDAALKVMESMRNMPNKWIPGKQRGQVVAVSYKMPVKFKLEK